MASEIATSKETGGGGYVFEDQVAAYYLAYLLSNASPFGADFGTLVRVDFQTRVDGWFLDDILLTLQSKNAVHYVALSVKSNSQFGAKSAPSEFVNQIWEQFLHIDTSKFEPSNDLLGIVVPPLHQPLHQELQELLSLCRSEDTNLLPDRLKVDGFASKCKRGLFSSFACPTQIASKYGSSASSTAELLGSVRVVSLDFQSNPSMSEQFGVHMCQSSLQSGEVDEALELWLVLQRIARDARQKSGYIDIRRLVILLNSHYRLKEFPNYQPDWQNLIRLSTEKRDAVRDTIGNRVSIDRTTDVAKIDEALKSAKVVVVLGPSGCGKTIIAKQWAQSQPENACVLWWDATSFDPGSSSTLELEATLTHSLSELVKSATVTRGYLIVDRLDQVLGPTEVRKLAGLLNAFRDSKDEDCWRTLLTCQGQSWDQVQSGLHSANVSTDQWLFLEVQEPDNLDIVWETFPRLRRLMLRPELQRLLLKPKVLDLLATRSETDTTPDTTSWVGESDLAKWFWETEVRKGKNPLARAKALMSLGLKQADDLQALTSLIGLESVEAIDMMVKDRLLKTSNGSIGFDHDLYGDWSRLQVLLAQEPLQTFIADRIRSPLWHRALRLYGVHLLEQNRDTETWRQAVSSLASPDGGANTAQDLLVEAIIFAADPLSLLKRTYWPDLAENDGLLLKRLLGRFFIVATRVNTQLIGYIAGLGLPTTGIVNITNRVPYLHLWIPLIEILNIHRADAVRLVPAHAADIANRWLDWTPRNFALRAEAAQMALDVATAHVQSGYERSANEAARKIYRAALAAAWELPEQVCAIALQASGRAEPVSNVAEQPGQAAWQRSYRSVKSRSHSEDYITPKPWPPGPRFEVDPEFAEVCLESDALHDLIDRCPEVACEVMLAIIIEEPRPRSRRLSSHDLLSDLMGLSGRSRAWDPPLYKCQPLLYFLNHKPIEALDFAISLVNFAAQRWAEWPSQGAKTLKVTLDTRELEWIGDANVYYWYRELGGPPDAVVATLMALEKWLYDKIDADAAVSGHVETLLQRTETVAVAGVLMAVGLRHPALFSTVLKPLLATPELHIWQESCSHREHMTQAWAIPWAGEPQKDLARKLAYHATPQV